jgi:predicted nucleic acid-binding protein
VLGFHRLTPEDKHSFELFFRGTHIYSVSDTIHHSAAKLRQQRKLGLGDAIIAATASLNRLIVVTSNTKDFQWIPGLKIFNPLATP